jgi:alpha-tubulin suppressor-like RCC1 family protein
VVAAGAIHTMAVRTDGTLWGWGSNAEGQLGDGNGDEVSPVQIGTGANWVTVSAGTGHSFGLKADNTLWGWGRNRRPAGQRQKRAVASAGEHPELSLSG